MTEVQCRDEVLIRSLVLDSNIHIFHLEAVFRSLASGATIASVNDQFSSGLNRMLPVTCHLYSVTRLNESKLLKIRWAVVGTQGNIVCLESEASFSTAVLL